MLWIVHILLFVKKSLLTGTEHEFCSADNAFQNSIGEFHRGPPSLEDRLLCPSPTVRLDREMDLEE